jgi:hypothetical protein
MKTAFPQGTRIIVAVIRAQLMRAVHRSARRVTNAAAAMGFLRSQRRLLVASAQATVDLITGCVRSPRMPCVHAFGLLPRSHVAARPF